MHKKKKKHIFSENPWNDTPYYDMFEELWKTYGMIDVNHWYKIINNNRFHKNDRLWLTEIYKWPERI